MSVTQPSKGRSIELEGSGNNLTFPAIDSRGLGQRYFELMDKNKDKINQVDASNGVTETNGSVRIRAIQVSKEITKRGVTQQDVVLLFSRTNPNQCCVVLATLLAGAILAPLDPDLSSSELKVLLGKLKPKLAFCDNRNLGQLENALRQADCLCSIIHFGKAQTDGLAFDKLFETKNEIEFSVTASMVAKKKTAFIVPSQGTTLTPNLVCLTHSAIHEQVCMCAQLFKDSQKVISFFPLSWIPQLILICYSFEMPIIRILAGNFTERVACRFIHDFKIDTAFLSTDFALNFCTHPAAQDYDISCLKALYVGNTAASACDMVHLRKHLYGVKVMQCYGLTEVGGLLSGFSLDQYQLALENPGSVGQLLPGLKIRVVDIETREPVGQDFWGELIVAGPSLMSGYYKDQEASDKVLEKGFLKTGDIVQYDAKGCLYVQGRITDLVAIDGIRFAVNELEELIMAHSSVTEAIVLGDDKELVACVIVKPDSNINEQKLMAYIAERTEEKKRPTRIKFYDAFPKTSIGRIRREILRHQLFEITIMQSKSSISI